MKGITNGLLNYLYSTMVRIRLFEEKVNDLFLKGELPGFVHLYIGEEAIAAGTCANLRTNDYITSTHRGHGHTIAKGTPLREMMAEIFGKKTGSCKGKGGSMHIADFRVGMLGANGVVGGGYTLAVGAALACKMQHRDNVAVCFFGDGASNRGTFHEALNMAAAWKLPVIFICENNQWASTTPYRSTTSVENISDRALGYGIPGVVIDGNDVFQVHEETAKAVKRARGGEGPMLIEAKTYRIKGHYVGDPEMYRAKEEVRRIFTETDPITRFKEKVLSEGILTEEDMYEMEKRAAVEIEEALQFALESPYPDSEELFSDLYIGRGCP